MTAVTRAKSVVDSLLGKTVPVAKRKKILSRFAVYLNYVVVDLTDEEIAEVFLEYLLNMVRDSIVSMAETVAQDNHRSDIKAARDLAKSDFD